MIKIGAFDIDNISLSAERRFCQEIWYRIGLYDHFHSPKNPSVEYQMSGNHLVLIFNFGKKASNYDIGIICCLVEEEFHFRKSYMKTKGWSENFAVNVKKEEVCFLFSNYYKEI